MTSQLRIDKKGENDYEITVLGPPLTTHRVTLSPDYHQKLTGGNASEEELLQKSFEFLLERESNSMIMSHFDLPVISRYFPEYESVISKNW
jgi:hypothetical protein